MQVCYCRVFLHRSVIAGCPRAGLLLWGLPFKVCYCWVSPLQSVTVGSPLCWFVIVGSPHVGLLLQGVPRQVCYCRVSSSPGCTCCSGGVAWGPLGGCLPPISKGSLRGDPAYPLSGVGVPLCVPWHGRGTKPPSSGDKGTPEARFGGARAGGGQGAQGSGCRGMGKDKEGVGGDVKGAGEMLVNREMRCQGMGRRRGMGCQGMGCQDGVGGTRGWGVRTRT